MALSCFARAQCRRNVEFMEKHKARTMDAKKKIEHLRSEVRLHKRRLQEANTQLEILRRKK